MRLCHTGAAVRGRSGVRQLAVAVLAPAAHGVRAPGRTHAAVDSAARVPVLVAGQPVGAVGALPPLDATCASPHGHGVQVHGVCDIPTMGVILTCVLCPHEYVDICVHASFNVCVCKIVL